MEIQGCQTLRSLIARINSKEIFKHHIVTEMKVKIMVKLSQKEARRLNDVKKKQILKVFLNQTYRVIT